MPNYDDYLDFHYADEYARNAYEDIDDLYDDEDYDYDNAEDEAEWDNYYHSVADEITDD
jgi:hypothetical protein